MQLKPGEPFIPAQQDTTDYRRNALLDLAAFCSGIIPTTVGINPTEQDGIELAKDLRLLATRVDRVIEAYGDYADSRIGVDMSLFKGQLDDALTGNAIWEIETEAKEREDERSEPDPDAAYDRLRDERDERS
jgi:hypothetical protein